MGTPGGWGRQHPSLIKKIINLRINAIQTRTVNSQLYTGKVTFQHLSR